MQFAFDNFAQFIDMGGRAPFVWSCWALVCIGLIWFTFNSIAQRNKTIKGIEQQIKQYQKQQAQ